MDSIRFVHISDIHFEKDNEEGFELRVLGPFLEQLKTINEDKKIDFLCITGDLINQGTGGYESSKEAFNAFSNRFLEQIKTTINISNNNIFLAPGNHDVDCSKISKILENGLKSTLINSEAVSEFEKSISNENYEGLERVLPFKEFEKEFYSGISDSYISYFSSNHIRNYNGIKVGITCLNSVWRYNKTDDNLIFGERQLEESIDRIKDCDIKILLSHYCINCSAQFERDVYLNLTSEFYPIQLFGHTHSQKTYCESNNNEGFYFVNRSTGLLKNNAKSFDIRYLNGFSIIDFDISEDLISWTEKVYSDKLRKFVNNSLVTGDKGGLSYKLYYRNSRLTEMHKIAKQIKNSFIYEMDTDLLVSGIETEAPREFKNIFVEPRLCDKQNSTQDDECIVQASYVCNNPNNYSIIGTAESGKTVLLDFLVSYYIEHIDDLQSIPVYIDYRHMKRSTKIEKCISTFTEISIRNVEEFVSSTKIVLLIDNYNYDDYEFERKLLSFVDNHPKTSFILAITNNMTEEIPMRFVSAESYKRTHTLVLKYFNKKQITELSNKWYSKSDDLNINEKKEKIIELLTTFELPRTPLTVSMFLWIFETQKDCQPVNQAIIMEIFIEKLFKKHDIEQSLYSNFDYKDKERLLVKIALKMLKSNNDNYALKYSELLEFVSEYLEKLLLSFSAEEIINSFIDVNLFQKEVIDCDTYIQFKYNCFFQYFLMKNLNEPDFKKWVLEGENYLLFANEINLYTGEKRDSVEILKFVIEKMNTYYDAFSAFLINKDISFDSFFEKDYSVVEKLDDKKVQLLSSTKQEVKENIEEIKEMTLESSPVSNKIVKKNLDMSFLDKMGQSFIIAANVLRNSEWIEEDELKYSSFTQVLSASFKFLCLYKIAFISEIKEKFDDFSPEKQKEIYMYLTFLPLAHESLLKQSLGTAKLNQVTKNHIDFLNKNECSQLEKFCSVFLYSDFKGRNYLSEIKSFIKGIKQNYIKDLCFFKLYEYYLLRANSSKEENDILNILADLRIPSGIGNKGRYKGQLKSDLMKSKKDFNKNTE